MKEKAFDISHEVRHRRDRPRHVDRHVLREAEPQVVRPKDK